MLTAMSAHARLVVLAGSLTLAAALGVAASPARPAASLAWLAAIGLAGSGALLALGHLAGRGPGTLTLVPHHAKRVKRPE